MASGAFWNTGYGVQSLTETAYVELPEQPPKIKTCPLCGSKAIFKNLHAYWIECTCCKLSTPAYSDINVLADAWNGGMISVAGLGQKMKGAFYNYVQSAYRVPADADAEEVVKDPRIAEIIEDRVEQSRKKK